MSKTNEQHSAFALSEGGVDALGGVFVPFVQQGGGAAAVVLRLGHVLARKIRLFQSGEAEKALEDCVWRMEQCRLEIEKLASSVALAEYEQEAGPARLAKLARSVQ